MPETAMLIALPFGLCVSGVTTWAVRLAGGLARAGHPCSLVLHPEPPGSAVLAASIDPRVRVTRLRNVPAIDATGGDLSPFLAPYRQAINELQSACPVVLSPNLHGDCYGIAAALAAQHPKSLRIIGWQHSDIVYDTRVLAHYSPILTRFVAVSARIEERLRAALADRAPDIRAIPYGVAAEAACPQREPLRDRRGKPRPVRLIYSGRIDHQQKRILALAALSSELARRGMAHELIIVGEGPARGDLEAALEGNRSIRRMGALPPDAVAALLAAADALVLPSRFEGLSVAMLEAMACGCVPIVTRVESGLGEAIRDGYNGMIADAGPEATEHEAGTALAAAIARFVASDAAALSESARLTVEQRFSLGLHISRVQKLLAETSAAPPRTWPASQPFAFTAPGAGGSVPPDGPDKMKHVLDSLAGRRIAIHGTGEHTRQLRDVILASPATLVAFADDNPAVRGRTMWGLPVLAPDQCAAAGATDVVISSWMHQEDVWARRSAYRGLNVHRLYVA